MSTNWTLGSFIPTPVTADIVSFMELEDKQTFARSSTNANALVSRYRLIGKHLVSFSFRFDCDKHGFLNIGRGYGSMLKTHLKCGSSEAEALIAKILDMFKSVERINWGSENFKCTFNNIICKKLKLLEIYQLNVFGTVDVSVGKFLELCSKVEILELHGCEMQNYLINNKIVAVLCRAKIEHLTVFPSPTAYTEDPSNCQTTVNDEFLKGLRWFPTYIKFEGFFTKFTVACIKLLLEKLLLKEDFMIDWDLGILDADQAEAALAYQNEIMNTDENQFYWARSQQVSANGRRFIHYHISFGMIGDQLQKTVCFAVPLEPSPVTLTVNDEYDEFESLHLDIFSSLGDGENKKYDVIINFAKEDYRNGFRFHSMYAKHHNRYKPIRPCSYMLRIECISEENFVVKTSIVTDIDESTAEKLIKAFLSKCGLIRELYWYHRVFSDNVYELLKSAEVEKIRFEWTETAVASNYLIELYTTEIVKKLSVDSFNFGCLYKEKLLPSKYLSDEVLYGLLSNNVSIHVRWNDKLKEAMTTLSDKLLVDLAKTETPLSLHIEVGGYRTGFTIEGIKQNLWLIADRHAKRNDYDWNLGILDSNQQADAVRFVESIQSGHESRWKLNGTHWIGSFLQSFWFSTKSNDQSVSIDIAMDEKCTVGANEDASIEPAKKKFCS